MGLSVVGVEDQAVVENLCPIPSGIDHGGGKKRSPEASAELPRTLNALPDQVASSHA